MVKPRFIQKLADVSKVGTKTLQTQHLNLVSKRQTLLTSRAGIATTGRIVVYEKNNISILNSWQITDEYVHF